MFTESMTVLFWSILACEFLIAFGLITYLVGDEKRKKRLQ